MIWTVCNEEDDAGKMVLSTELNDQQKLIRIDASKTFSTTVALPREISLTNAEVCLAVESYVLHHFKPESDASQYLDRWVPLPWLGGNRILLRRETMEHQELVMFPRLNAMQLEFWFHSQWYQGSIRLIQADGLKLCPQDQIWPYCSWCRRFHLPHEGPGSHRNGGLHASFEEHLARYGHDAMRVGCRQWSTDLFLG